VIVLNSVTKFAGDDPKNRAIFQDLDFTVRRGESVGVLGHPKSGKTTFINLVNANTKPNFGEARHGMSVSWPIASRQTFNKTLSIRTNIRFISEMYGAWTPDILERVSDMAKIRHEEMDKTIRQISDDTHSRAVFCLCLAMDFDCYVADENLFIGNRSFRVHAHKLIQDLKGRSSLVVATKNLQLVRDFCDTCYVLQGGGLIPYPNAGAAIRAFKSTGKDAIAATQSTEESVLDQA
jgi:ABC-type polysaccharide/polyol phosphate transport system ATPase subunit